jgi:hypothetical protein
MKKLIGQKLIVQKYARFESNGDIIRSTILPGQNDSSFSAFFRSHILPIVGDN